MREVFRRGYWDTRISNFMKLEVDKSEMCLIFKRSTCTRLRYENQCEGIVHVTDFRI